MDIGTKFKRSCGACKKKREERIKARKAATKARQIAKRKEKLFRKIGEIESYWREDATSAIRKKVIANIALIELFNCFERRGSTYVLPAHIDERLQRVLSGCSTVIRKYVRRALRPVKRIPGRVVTGNLAETWR